jgi:hypothetical protein
MDIKKELKNEGWKADNDVQAQKLMDDGMYSMFFFYFFVAGVSLTLFVNNVTNSFVIFFLYIYRR